MKLAVVASGWHHPYHFYKSVAEQELPDGWSMDLFVVSHRDPKFAKEEKKGKKLSGDRAYLDRKLYERMATVSSIKKLGWDYVEEPNTVGDWGNSNQWLVKHNYKDYDLLLFTHDDNLIISKTWLKDVIQDEAFADWEILANSLGMPQGWIRGSCEFFKPSFLDKIGGLFDLSEVSLDRTGETSVSESTAELYDWNNTVNPLMKFVQDNEIKVGYLSPSYRFSMFVLEGERGYISNTHGQNTAVEEEGLEVLRHYGAI